MNRDLLSHDPMSNGGQRLPLLPPEQMTRFEQARDLYLSGKFDDALVLDEQILRWAKGEPHLMGQVLGLRFMGLCHYRMSKMEKSAQRLTEAIELARSAGLLEQELLCANHLSATFMQQGNLLSAHKLLTESLDRARLPGQLHARARLHGNMGALFDELGQRALADIHYALMEELCEILGHPDRLANARGLVARSARLRGDLRLAAQKSEGELLLAKESKNFQRQVAALLDLAEVHVDRSPDSADTAMQLIDEALSIADQHTLPRRSIDGRYIKGKLLHKSGKFSAAYHTLDDALRRSRDHYPEKEATIRRLMATLCKDARLHGEALWHLQRAARLLHERFEPLRKDEVRKMAQARLNELVELVDELLGEACRVARDGEEKRGLERLVQQVRGEPADWDKLLDSKHAHTPVWQWQEQLKEEAAACWKKLLPGGFERLSPASQSDLIRAEVSYGSAVNDLARSAHLLALVVERELRERMKPNGKTHALQALLDQFRLKGGDLHKKIPDGFNDVHPIDGSEALSLVQIRNAVAHGEESTRYPNLRRLQIDAVKRFLLFGTADMQEPPLAYLSTWTP